MADTSRRYNSIFCPEPNLRRIRYAFAAVSNMIECDSFLSDNSRERQRYSGKYDYNVWTTESLFLRKYKISRKLQP